MIGMFFKKEQQLESLTYSYLDNLGMIHTHFAKAMNVCLDVGLSDDFHFLTEQTHKYESKADDIREEINLLIYSKALIPESREDIMGLVEAINEIPRYFELLLHVIQTQKLAIPEPNFWR